MTNGKFSLVVLLGIALVGVGVSAFTVDETELAIKLRLGEVIRADYEPGLNWKIPAIHTIRKFPKRILTISDRPERLRPRTRRLKSTSSLNGASSIRFVSIPPRVAPQSLGTIDCQKSSRML